MSKAKAENDLIFKQIGNRAIYPRLIKEGYFGTTLEEIYETYYEDVVKALAISNVIS